mmetsp:Transcript_30077/g.87610  ORF Transcript_30077/g.87610 Transcript_30077/m.87610 type:complete len:236 (+) Transcript_30077:630-1337(+)
MVHRRNGVHVAPLTRAELPGADRSPFRGLIFYSASGDRPGAFDEELRLASHGQLRGDCLRVGHAKERPRHALDVLSSAKRAYGGLAGVIQVHPHHVMLGFRLEHGDHFGTELLVGEGQGRHDQLCFHHAHLVYCRHGHNRIVEELGPELVVLVGLGAVRAAAELDPVRHLKVRSQGLGQVQLGARKGPHVCQPFHIVSPAFEGRRCLHLLDRLLQQSKGVVIDGGGVQQRAALRL